MGLPEHTPDERDFEYSLEEHHRSDCLQPVDQVRLEQDEQSSRVGLRAPGIAAVPARQSARLRSGRCATPGQTNWQFHAALGVGTAPGSAPARGRGHRSAPASPDRRPGHPRCPGPWRAWAGWWPGSTRFARCRGWWDRHSRSEPGGDDRASRALITLAAMNTPTRACGSKKTEVWKLGAPSS